MSDASEKERGERGRLPARLGDAWDLSTKCVVAESDTGHAKLADKASGATCYTAAVLEASGTGVAGEVRELAIGFAARFWLSVGIFDDRGQSSATFCVTLNQLLAPFIACNLAFLGHGWGLLCCTLYDGLGLFGFPKSRSFLVSRMFVNDLFCAVKSKTSYKNHSTNIAACVMQGIKIPTHNFTEDEIDEAMVYLNQRMHLIPEEMHPYLLKQYSNSVL